MIGEYKLKQIILISYLRTIHKYLSLEWHEAHAAVKPEVFMASTHVLMPFEAAVFMDGYIVQTYLYQF